MDTQPIGRITRLAAVLSMLGCLSCGDGSRRDPPPSSRVDLMLLAPLMAEDVRIAGSDYMLSALRGRRNWAMQANDPRELAFVPGSTRLPMALLERTFLTGTLGSPASIPVVVGSVLEIPGTDSGGICTRPRQVDLAQIYPGRVLKDDVKLEVNLLGEILFNDIVEKQTILTAGYFAFTTSLGKDDRAEILIRDVAGQRIENYDRDKDPAKIRAIESEALAPGMCGRYVITALMVTSVTYRVYGSRKKEGKVLGILNIGGKQYYTRTQQINDVAVGITLQPIRFTKQSAGGEAQTTSSKPPKVLIVQ